MIFDGDSADPPFRLFEAVLANRLEIGGLGIHLVRKVMNRVSYSRRDGKNVVVLVKCLGDDADA